jgi:L-aspartate oxidase
MCLEGPDRIRDLITLGVEFDRVARNDSEPTNDSRSTNDSEPTYDSGLTNDLALAQEAAHSARRIVHAGGDATGHVVEAALVRAVRARSIEVHEHTFMRDLVVQSDNDGVGRVVGIDVSDVDGVDHRILADRVVLATGGAGQLYRHTTNPSIATGDGAAAAWRAGAVLTDVEFYQFHPTALAVANSPLISEAVRGEGAVLLDENGHRFMLAKHPDAELAPRDVVARAMASVMAKQGGRPVLLDASALGADFLTNRFPGITTACSAAGIDWSREPVPVAPAAHYWMGGIRTDARGRTSIPGLFAVGEVASTGVQGANRLASNSLLEALVFAWRVGDTLDDPARAAEFPPGDNPQLVPAFAEAVPVGATLDGAVSPLPFSRLALQQLLWNHVGLERTRDGLTVARAQLEFWSAAATDRGTVADLEDRNLLDVARLIVRAALAREESRGAHYRRDFPVPDERQAQSRSWKREHPAIHSATTMKAMAS